MPFHVKIICAKFEKISFSSRGSTEGLKFQKMISSIMHMADISLTVYFVTKIPTFDINDIWGYSVLLVFTFEYDTMYCLVSSTLHKCKFVVKFMHIYAPVIYTVTNGDYVCPKMKMLVLCYISIF